MKLLLAGGGTGGHIYPALAIAEAASLDDVLFVGEYGGMAERLVAHAGFPFQPIARRQPGRNLLTPFIILGDFLRALRFVRQWKPDVVIGTGGYVSACAVWSGRRLKIPTVILDFNALPGRTNRRLAQRVDKIGISFEDAFEYFPKEKTVLTGTPVRRAVLTAQRTPSRARWNVPPDAKVLVVFGGSQAAQSINNATFAALPHWLDQHTNLHVIHLCGERDEPKAQDTTRNTQHARRYHPMSFCHDMGDVLAAADLVLCRAGGVSIAEITARGLPAILVPYPHAMDNHQEYNARALERHGAAVVVLDHDLSHFVTEHVGALLSDETKLRQLAEASRAQGKPDATERVLTLARSLIAESR
jgi:UDP-N-acetylglucosamine--N-acetylmuramyl-(pentapeptide) pyrophosphoryl-undecaprenol N-acetylglucosamine transferase